MKKFSFSNAGFRPKATYDHSTDRRSIERLGAVAGLISITRFWGKDGERQSWNFQLCFFSSVCLVLFEFDVCLLATGSSWFMELVFWFAVG